MFKFLNKDYKNFREFFGNIIRIKMDVRLLYGKELVNAKNEFYKLPFSNFRKDKIWEFIWDELTYDKLKKIMQL